MLSTGTHGLFPLTGLDPDSDSRAQMGLESEPTHWKKLCTPVGS